MKRASLPLQRRQFITLLGAAAAWPVIARAQQPAMPVIGFLNQQTADLVADQLRSFRQGLGETGYMEGRNVAIEYRWADDQIDRLPALATDLVRRPVTVIGAFNVPAILAAKAATATIPIVFFTGADPVELGFVGSLARPGNNLTGTTTLNVEVGPKRLEALHALVPAATSIAVLVNPTNPNNAETQSGDMQAAARTLGLQLHFLRARTTGEIDAAFARLIELRAGALIVDPDPFFGSRSEQLAALTLRHSLPATGALRAFVTAGGLMSYGTVFSDAYRVVGVYAGRILKGEKPADLPVQQATKVELVVNLKTAKALGITLPTALLVRADEVIE